MLVSRLTYHFVSGLAVALLTTAPAAEPEPDWSEWDLEARIDAVSDGQLRFLSDETEDAVHVHENRIRIRAEDLAGGWVVLDQCHEHLDPVPATEITFNPERIRNLQITSIARIGHAQVDGHRVQLQDIEAGARLCLAAESRALQKLGQGHYRLRTGPYMRRFLDGYYRMRVVIDVRFPSGRIELIGIQPPPQPGLEISSEPGRLRLDISFEGRLFSCLDFRSRGAEGDKSPDLDCQDN